MQLREARVRIRRRSRGRSPRCPRTPRRRTGTSWPNRFARHGRRPGAPPCTGPHQLAQKLRTMGLPFRSESFTGAPVSSRFRVKSGAGLPRSWKGTSCGSRPEALRQHEEQHRGDRGERQAHPQSAPAHAAAPGLRAPCRARGAARAASARARRRSGQAAMSAPSTKSGRLHQIHATIGKIHALKLAEGLLPWSKARSVRYRSSKAAVRMAGLPTGRCSARRSSSGARAMVPAADRR